ncbi:bifunctional diguanylate cyclase/phosphodiesterase [Catenovulum sediminis]|uniref:EAL domain-containing protein n=1 Tax=Catenovulum sediminis TaxID=1740262 RepID=A0ABV1RHS7_9ALTE
MMKIARKSLKYAIIKRLIALFLLSLSVIGLTLFYVEKDLAKEKLLSDLNVIGEILANRTVAALIFNDVAAAQTNLSAAQFHQSIQHICLYNKEKEFFAQYIYDDRRYNCPPTLGVIDSYQQHFNENGLNIIKPVLDNQEIMGALMIQSDLKYVQSTQQHVLLVILIVISISLLAVYAIANQLLKRVLAPLQHLHSTAQHITKNVFADIRAYKSKEDEVGQLVDVFNNMLDSLADEHKLLQLSEQRLRSLSDQAPIGIFLRDEQDRYLYVNNSWQDMTGCKLPIDFIEYSQRIAYPDNLRVLEMFNESQLNKTTSSVEYRFTTPQGKRKNFLEKISPVTLNDGQLTGYIGSVLDITELKEARFELEKMAYQDPLTGLANRRFFNEHLKLEIANALKLKQQLAVLMVDLDNFKRVNDAKGHEFGDDLLVSVANKLKKALADDDLVSRMGGDEFMILIRDVATISSLDLVVKKLLSSVLTPLEHQALLDVTASIGVAVYPKDGVNGADLIRSADIALYKAKDFGRNQVVYFSDTLDKEIKAKVHLEHKLRQAISDEALTVYLQPQFDAQKNRFIWAEALVRWIDKDEGFIPPDKFIGVAEETGLIHDLGLLVLRQVCRYLQQHGKALRLVGIDGIAVNLSSRQLFAKNFYSSVMEMLASYAISPQQIEFEVTESLLMENTEQAIRLMQLFKDQGFRLAMDDFGTGYSSLAYLKQFPVDCVKIDRNFIKDIPQDEQDKEISSAIIAMAQKLGLDIVAEGVETIEQSEFLQAQGCRVMQGYYYAKPMPIEQTFNLTADFS